MKWFEDLSIDMHRCLNKVCYATKITLLAFAAMAAVVAIGLSLMIGAALLISWLGGDAMSAPTLLSLAALFLLMVFVFVTAYRNSDGHKCKLD